MVPYVSADELAASIGGDVTKHVADYERAVNAATEQIDRWTGRRFLRDSSPSARLFRADSGYRVCVGDFTDPSEVVVETDDLDDGTWSTWDSSEWRAEADDDSNGSFVRLGGEPWRWVAATGAREFPVHQRRRYWSAYDGYGWPGESWRYGQPQFPENPRLAGPARVRVTTSWGWEEPPAPVLQACLELAIMHFQPGNRAPEVLGTAAVEAAKHLLMEYAVEGGTLVGSPTVG